MAQVRTEVGSEENAETRHIFSGSQDWSQVSFFRSQRFFTTVLAFFGFLCLSLQRINLSITIVCMVGDELNNETYNGTLNVSDDKRPGQLKSTGQFTWSKELQGVLLGGYFWGYLVLQIPGGRLSEYYGPRRVIFYTMLPVSFLTCLSPVCAEISPYCLLFVRILIGVGESAYGPCLQTLLYKWAHPLERSRFMGVCLSGSQIGVVIGFPLAGVLCNQFGWESVFYLTGSLGFVWCILWFFLASDGPELSTRISELESRYILAHRYLELEKNHKNIPWRDVFTSLPFIAILVAHTCFNYGQYMMLTQTPTYINEVLSFDIKTNGILSMLPYLVLTISITAAAYVSDKLVMKKILTLHVSRKLFTSIGMLIPALCMTILMYIDRSKPILAIVLLCGSVGFYGVAFSGVWSNHGDIAPQFSGTLFGITNFVGTIPGILAPYIVGLITTNGTQEEWRVVFLSCASIYFFGCIFYIIFGRASVQNWAKRFDLE